VSRPTTLKAHTRLPICFNPVLGFLSVSTSTRHYSTRQYSWFQSRAGFSECLDSIHSVGEGVARYGFNPVLGFLSVSTFEIDVRTLRFGFQSRAGFSECLDGAAEEAPRVRWLRFNPVLGFLSVSTLG